MPHLRRLELFFLSAIFLISVMIRCYYLPQNLFFGFEQGRDAQIIQNIWQKHDFKLVGPKTDLAGIFHGAYNYYLLLPAYVLGGGNPLAASFLLIVLSSTLPLIYYFFAKDVFRSTKAAILTSVLATISYEYIIYARWLSNVTPAIPLIALTFWLLWKYQQQKKSWQIVSACLAAALAAQFEIVLVLFWAWVGICLLCLRVIRLPNWRIILVAVIVSGAIFVPHAIYNWRNQNIIGQSILSFASGGNKNGTKSSLNISANLHAAKSNYATILQHTFSLPKQTFLASVFGLVILLGIVGTLRSQQQQIKKVLFFLCWLFMPLPALFFPDVAQLTQLYLGVGLALIFLFVLAMQNFWQRPIGKIAVSGCLLIILSGLFTSLSKLQKNDDVFFVTIQTSLNYFDQQRALQFVHQDAADQTYRLVAYTIPYLQPEGWQYLRHYFYPQDQVNDGSKLVYVIIEEKVDPFWEKKWNEDLGVATSVVEKQFGLIRVQKRLLQ